jgi:dTDP-4-amino-4,6-dideoxygalactose transaminase
MIPYGRQHIDSQDIKSVSNSLKNNLITTGKIINKFEKKLKFFFNSKYAISCSSGTAGLHLSLLAIGVKENDVIVMPAINFVAIYNLCSLLKAKIFLADVDSSTGQMTPETLMQCIKKNNLKKIKVIVTMYLGGYPENNINFYKIKKKFNTILLEDACHSLGTTYKYKSKDLKIGCCKHSDISVFSLHPVKTITTGEGGVVTTNNNEIAKKLFLFRSHGILREKNKHWSYDVICNGLNCRLSDINCALGISQLKKIKKFIAFRKKINEFYKKNLFKFFLLPDYNKNNKSAYHLFLVQFRDQKKSLKEKFIKYLKKNQIIAQYHYIPIYKFSVYKKNVLEKFKNSEIFFKHTVSLPIFYNLNYKKQKFILWKIKLFFKKYSV